MADERLFEWLNEFTTYANRRNLINKAFGNTEEFFKSLQVTGTQGQIIFFKREVQNVKKIIKEKMV